VQDMKLFFGFHLTADEAVLFKRLLLKTKASELTEVRRKSVRLTNGYGDATTRESLNDSADEAQRSYDLLTDLCEQLKGIPT